MLADDHRSLGVKEARLFAEKNDLAFIEGKEAIRWSLKKGRALVPKLKS
jgi:hypothetical protein